MELLLFHCPILNMTSETRPQLILLVFILQNSIQIHHSGFQIENPHWNKFKKIQKYLKVNLILII